MKAPPPLPGPLQQLWDEAWACRRCFEDSRLRPELNSDTYIAFPTIGLLPPGTQRGTYVLVGSEPSPAFKSREQAKAQIALGLRNHGDGRRAGCVQYAVERWLLVPGEGYYLTDLAKCTVPGDVAGRTREPRYSLCSDYLAREVELLRPRAIIGIGLDSFRYMRAHRRPGWPALFSVLHYSAQALAHRKKFLEGAWASQVPSLTEIDAFIESRRLEGVHSLPHRKANLTHLELLNAYRVQFGMIRTIIEEGSYASGTRAMVRVSAGP